jgi:hypothetical protein
MKAVVFPGRAVGAAVLLGAALASACARPRTVVRTQPDSAAREPVRAAATHVPAAAAEPACAPVETAVHLRERLRAEVAQAFAFRKATPLLVDRWPAPTSIVVLTYESRALPTGAVTYELRTPAWQLVVAPLGAPARASQLPAPKVLGRERGPVDDQLQTRLAGAEQALVEAVAGCHVACEKLEAYRAWTDAHPALAAHLAKLPGVAIPCTAP